MDKNQLPKSLHRYAARLADYSDERGSSELIFVSYRPGWKSSEDPVGNQHGDTAVNVAEARDLISSAMRCECADCIASKCEETGDGG